jgi:hypothetical protein
MKIEEAVQKYDHFVVFQTFEGEQVTLEYAIGLPNEPTEEDFKQCSGIVYGDLREKGRQDEAANIHVSYMTKENLTKVLELTE